jgi:hypothetical protein
VFANQAIFAHFQANQAHHCTNVSASLASPTGSSVIVFLSHSILPYLSTTAWRHSSVHTSFTNQTIVSKGFVIPLAVADAVFSKDQGVLATIVGSASIPSKGVPLKASATDCLVIVGIF